MGLELWKTCSNLLFMGKSHNDSQQTPQIKNFKSLANHIRKHGKSPTFKCHICDGDKMFASSGTLIAHYINFHLHGKSRKEQMFAVCQSEDVWFNIKFHLSCFHSVFISCMCLGQEDEYCPCSIPTQFDRGSYRASFKSVNISLLLFP